jgi:hypothetical protein
MLALQTFNVVHLDLNGIVPSAALLSAVSSQTSLLTLIGLHVPSGLASYIDFSQMTALSTLAVTPRDINMYGLTKYLVRGSTLRSLSIIVTAGLNMDELLTFTSLEELTIGCNVVTLPLRIPFALRKLEITSFGTPILSFADGSSLFEELIVNSLTLTTIAAPWPTNTLKRLTLNADQLNSMPNVTHTLESLAYGDSSLSTFPGELELCINLKTLSFQGGMQSFYDSLPALFDSPVQSIIFSTVLMTDTSLERVLCSIPSLEELVIANGATIVHLPSCLLSFSHLKSVAFPLSRLNPESLYLLPSNLESLTVQNPQNGWFSATLVWANFVDHFPSLKQLLCYNCGLSGTFPSTELSQLVNLTTLGLPSNYITGPVAPNFFSLLPNLEEFSVTDNHISGMLPWYGYYKLRTLFAESNNLQAWPAIVGGAPELRKVRLAMNQLIFIPDDNSFRSAPKLEELNLRDNPNLDGPLPTFWTSSLNMEFLDVSYCRFEGTIPSPITAPNLEYIKLDNNRLCGNLPEVGNTIDLRLFTADNNLLSGSIPSSWASNLFVSNTITLSRNYLNGTFPSPWLPEYTRKNIRMLYLQENGFTGPIFDMSDFAKASLLNMSVTYIDVCAMSPNATSALESCYFNGMPLGIDPCDCQTFYECSVCAPSVVFAPSAPASSSTPPSLIPNAILPPTIGQCIIPIRIPPPQFDLAPAIPTAVPINPVDSSPSASPTPVGCSLPAPQGNFICNNGVWESVGSVEEETLTVPGDSQIIVSGNLTVNNGITFNGINSQIVVNGCITIGGNTVIVQLTQSDLEQLSKQGKSEKTLLKSIGSCDGGSDLAAVAVSTQLPPKKGCKKVKTLNRSSHDSLNVLFQIDNTTCNMIIIIPSVIGGVLILTGIALTIGLVIRNKKFNNPTA